MKKLLAIFVLHSFFTSDLHSQDKIIKGRVIDNNLREVPYAEIVINDTSKVGKTDINGFFQIAIPDSTNKFLFSAVGIDWTLIELTDNCDEVEVVMMLTGTGDFMSPRKIDRRRMKKYKKLPALHKEAFEKGLFKTDKACYTQKFIPSST